MSGGMLSDSAAEATRYAAARNRERSRAASPHQFEVVLPPPVAPVADWFIAPGSMLVFSQIVISATTVSLGIEPDVSPAELPPEDDMAELSLEAAEDEPSADIPEEPSADMPEDPSVPVVDGICVSVVDPPPVAEPVAPAEPPDVSPPDDMPALPDDPEPPEDEPPDAVFRALAWVS